MTNIVELPKPDYKDAAKALRNIADDIDAGTYGDVMTVFVTLSGSEMASFGIGPLSDPPEIFFLIELAKAAVLKEVLDSYD